MEKSKLYVVFSALNKHQLSELKKAVRSPFFNQRGHVAKLFDFLLENPEHPDRRLAFEHLFPGLAYDDHKFRLSMSLLLKVIERYLAISEMERSDFRRSLHLAKKYRVLGLTKYSQKALSNAHQDLEDRQYENADTFHERYLLNLEEYIFSTGQKRTEASNLQAVMDNLDISHLAQKLRQACLSVSHQAVYRTEYRQGTLSVLMDFLVGHPFLEIPAIATYYHCYLALTQPSEPVHFHRFKKIIFEKGDKFPNGELRDLFLLAANFCIKKMNEGEVDFAKEGLEIYQEGLRREVMLVNGLMSRFTYRNIITKALVTRQISWAEKFAHEYASTIEDHHRDSTFNFNMARIEYERKNFEEALKRLQRFDSQDLLLQLSAKALAMKIYFEWEAFELLSSHLEAMRTFIRRKKILGYHRENYLNTVYLTRKLIELPPGNRNAKSELRKEVENTKAVAEKNWLLDQLN